MDKRTEFIRLFLLRMNKEFAILKTEQCISEYFNQNDKT